ncbi:TPA: hypothetical protein RQN23_002954 [Aeromonas veronii]|nr:hypothetical protein [Aeromonas veronii]
MNGTGDEKSKRKEMGPAELRLRMLLANPPKGNSGLFSPTSVVAPILVLVGLLLYWNFVVWPVLHDGQRFLTFLYELMFK